MRNLGRILSLSVLTVAAACTPTPREQLAIDQRLKTEQQKLDARLAGLTPGKPTSCMPQFGNPQVSSHGPTLLYRVSNSLIYRTDTTGGCADLDRNILITRTPTGQTCRGDIATTIDTASRFMTGSCSFGEFVPYRKR